MADTLPLPVETRPDGVVVLHLVPNPSKPRGGVVVLDRWLIDSIDVCLRHIATLRPKGFVLVSDSERVFVAGADLAEIDALDNPSLHAYLQAGSVAFRRITSLPCPTACVMHKAALGGGLELAMHCEALFGVTPAAGDKGWKIGLPECGLHICPGWGGTVLLPGRIEPATAIDTVGAGAAVERIVASTAGQRVIEPRPDQSFDAGIGVALGIGTFALARLQIGADRRIRRRIGDDIVT